MSHQTADTTALYRSDRSPEGQRAALTSGDVPVGVYGLGKMGLPLAAVYAEMTGNVRGADVDTDVVETVNRGGCHVENEPGLDSLVAERVEAGALRANDDPAAVAAASSLHVVIVPTLLTGDGDPDLSAVRAVARDVASGLSPGDMVVFESTLPPRTCRDELLPLIEAESGLELGEFGLAFCPERTKSGRALADIRGTHPKVVGGADDESTRVARLVYDVLSDNEVIPVDSATAAEAVKVFEGVYRDVNIALANELGRHAGALDIDVTDAIEAANTLPVCDIHTPGVGVGGHCIPYYPHFLISRFDEDSALMETARGVNEGMPIYTAEKALDALAVEGTDPSEATVLVMGLTYRPGVQEIRASPALGVVERLADAGVDVRAVDPVLDEYAAFEERGATIETLDSVQSLDLDGVVLVTQQTAFEAVDVTRLGGASAGRLVVVDGRQELTALRDDDTVAYRGVGLRD